MGRRASSADRLAPRPDQAFHSRIVRDFEQVYGSQPVLYVTEVHEVNEPTALKAVESAFDRTDLRIYDVNVPGLQHGILPGTRRWPRGLDPSTVA